MILPRQLQNDAFRFLKLAGITKDPVKGESWLEHLMGWKEAEKWLEAGNNVGIVGGYGDLRILDVDKATVENGLVNEVFSLLPTFTVKTGSGGYHFYFLSDYATNHPFSKDIGELRANNLYVVCPGCTWTDKGTGKIRKKYTVHCDLPIFEFDQGTIKKVVKIMGGSPKSELDKPVVSPLKKPLKVIPDSIDKLISGGVKKGERNVSAYIIIKELHNRGFEPGEILQQLLIFDGNSKPPKGETVVKAHLEYVLAHADKYLVDTVDKAWLETRDYGGLMVEIPEEKIKVLTDKELDEMEMPEIEWIIEGILPAEKLSILAARGKSYKTTTAIRMAASIVSGQDFFGHKVKQGKVIYFDAEVGGSGLRAKKNWIKKGMGLEHLDGLITWFARLNGGKILNLDSPHDFKRICELILNEKPILVVFDVLRRFISVKEDKADEMNKLFTQYILPLMETTKVAVLLVFHNRKRSKDEMKISPFDVDYLDLMDEIRGSSEIANIADSILLLKRLGKESPYFGCYCVPRYAEESENYFKITYDNAENSIKFDNASAEEIEAEQDIEDNEFLIKATAWLHGKEEFTTRDLKGLFDYKLNDTKITRLLNKLRDIGRIKKKSHGTYSILEDKNAQIDDF